MDFVGLTSTIHYVAPRCVDDYFQESGRAERVNHQHPPSTGRPLTHQSGKTGAIHVMSNLLQSEGTLKTLLTAVGTCCYRTLIML